MIRPARLTDIPAILEMVAELHAHTGQPQTVDRGHAAGFLAGLISGGGLCLVADVGGLCGFLAASRAVSSISPVPVAVEHGWFCRAPGWGGKLREAYEAWAGGPAKMSSGYGDERAAAHLTRAGYRPVEIAWVKGF